MIIRGKEKEMCEYIELTESEKMKEYFIITLINVYPLEDLSLMFLDCEELYSLSNLHK